MKSKSTVQALVAEESRALTQLKFNAFCKHSGQVYQYDFGGRPKYEHLSSVTGVFVWALYKLRHRSGHISRLSLQTYFWKFLNFLDERDIASPSQLNEEVMIGYINWLKGQTDLSYSTAASQYRALSPYFKQMSLHSNVCSSFWPKKNAFPKSSSLQSADLGYDEQELASIARAAAVGMRETLAKFNSVYQPQWIGKPPPLDDVATLGPSGRYSYWHSINHKIWWWENFCHCKRLNCTELARIPLGQVFTQSFRTATATAMVGVERFYDSIGAGENYVPKYLLQPSPIKFSTPWKKRDYLIWYWENKLGCKRYSTASLKKESPELYRALNDHFNGRHLEFFTSLGVHYWITALDLVPFYLMLLIRTQLNPSVIQNLKIDCLVPDPTDSRRKFLAWKKPRASKQGNTIPTDSLREGWPVSLVNKVLLITEKFREQGQSELWIANSNRHKKSLPLKSSGFKYALQAFSVNHGLVHTSGQPLSIQAKLIRPTMAWTEYIRTEDMRYLQTMLGHEKIGTTAEYLRRVGDPVFKNRRGVHIEAMFLKLTKEDASSELGLLDLTENLLTSCKNPKKSPVLGQKDGVMCTAGHEVCLTCANLVVTFDDIKKYFCYMKYHDELLVAGLITIEEHEWATAEKKFFWENQILKRYTPTTLVEIRKDADLYPIGIWSPTGEGGWL